MLAVAVFDCVYCLAHHFLFAGCPPGIVIVSFGFLDVGHAASPCSDSLDSLRTVAIRVLPDPTMHVVVVVDVVVGVILC